jgi:hypothetical protein
MCYYREKLAECCRGSEEIPILEQEHTEEFELEKGKYQEIALGEDISTKEQSTI